MPQKQPAQASALFIDLDKRGAAYSAGKLDVRFVLALAKRYNIEPIERRIGQGPAAISGFWFDLWFAVASECVPAFRTRRQGGAPRKQHRQSGSAWPYAHQARLVQLVDKFREENIRLDLPRTRPTLFARIVRHSKGYSWRYKDLKEASSFEQEWKKIPREVRQNPARFLPPQKLPRYKGGLVPTHLVKPEFERLQQVLPPVPQM
jgi:hypothetical protein